MKDLTKEQLEQKMKEHTTLVNDLFDKMEHLVNKTMKNDYKPSYEEAEKIAKIKTYADAILKAGIRL